MIDKDGRKVERIVFANEQDSVRATAEVILVFTNESHGDRDEEWVVQQNAETGEEISRHNVRFISSIYWQKED